MSGLVGTLLFAAGFCTPWLLLMLLIIFTDDTPASGIETEGQDGETRHGAEHESPTRQGDAR